MPGPIDLIPNIDLQLMNVVLAILYYVAPHKLDLFGLGGTFDYLTRSRIYGTREPDVISLSYIYTYLVCTIHIRILVHMVQININLPRLRRVCPIFTSVYVNV